MIIADTIRPVTVICCSIHKMPHAYTEAIPVPIKADEMQRIFLYILPAIANAMLPKEHNVKLSTICDKALNLKAMNIAANRMAAKEPQNILFTLAPSWRVNFKLDLTAKVATNVPHITSMPT